MSDWRSYTVTWYYKNKYNSLPDEGGNSGISTSFELEQAFLHSLSEKASMNCCVIVHATWSLKLQKNLLLHCFIHMFIVWPLLLVILYVIARHLSIPTSHTSSTHSMGCPSTPWHVAHTSPVPGKRSIWRLIMPKLSNTYDITMLGKFVGRNWRNFGLVT